ncbi:uncharacterized protein VP01_1547g2 [Puccinia sorghi]|uniref:HAT C-terminal dimerisation domain-containing protein n=1 Tax=Puccinia sorghi TaxID=27349 RepID=A0A0L6VIA2_9BASI|nr:uncharacterized protein VP01_1547g2 [Puccinia sorghi]
MCRISALLCSYLYASHIYPSQCMGSQRHRLASRSIERLVCVKEWYQQFNLMMDISSVSTPMSNTPGSDDDSDSETL